MTYPKPSVEEMLKIGLSCGLDMISEAYSMYMSHYDLFFYIPLIDEQSKEFCDSLKALSLTRIEKDGNLEYPVLVDERIVDAANRLNIPLGIYNEHSL